MVISNSYVKLPEGNHIVYHLKLGHGFHGSKHACEPRWDPFNGYPVPWEKISRWTKTEEIPILVASCFSSKWLFGDIHQIYKFKTHPDDKYQYSFSRMVRSFIKDEQKQKTSTVQEAPPLWNSSKCYFINPSKYRCLDHNISTSHWVSWQSVWEPWKGRRDLTFLGWPWDESWLLAS